MTAICALLLLGVFFQPLWFIALEAPQYPEGIRMFIWVNKITGSSENTLANINILNHYIGMKEIHPASIPELQIFPYVIGLLVATGLAISYFAKRKLFYIWAILLLVLSVLGIIDFWMWEYDYGHDLNPKAAIQVPGMVYQPPLFGSKWLLNFKAISFPHIGGLLLATSVMLSVVGLFFVRSQPSENS